MKAAILRCLLGLLLLLTPIINTYSQQAIEARRGPRNVVQNVDPDKPQEGVLIRTGANPFPIPLKQTDVKMSVFGFVASVNVEQTFVNSFSEKIEAVYVFPLPTNAAVDDMEIIIGKRKIHGEIKTREEARKEYEQAKDAGTRAALLEEQRPNIFTTAVANIDPNAQVVVKIHYTERIAYDDGGFRFAFPMVVAPRYIPADMQLQDGKLKRRPLPAISDAEKITPPNLPIGARPGNISLVLDLEAGFPIKNLSSITHDVKTEKISPSHYKIQLARKDEIPNRDFVLDYKIAGEQPEAVVMQSTDQQGDGYFLLMAAPPSDFKIKDLVAKEMIFIIDTSGSMQGLKIEQAKNAMRSCLRGLNPQDDFNIIRFSSDFQPMWQKSRSVSQENINEADQFVNNLRAAGGTEMLAPLMYALQNNKAMPGQPVKPRTVVFITDGQVGNEAQLLEAVKHNIGQAKIFTFGIDSAVNEYFLRKLAEIGSGTAEFLLPTQQNFETVINRFQSRISAPMLTNLAMDWGQMQVSDFMPNPIPDLYVNQPVFITGKFRSAGTREQIFVKALSAVGLTSMPVLIDTAASNIRFRAISSLWARAKVEKLSNDLIDSPANANTKQEIIDLGLKHKLLTPFTSFVALEEKTVVPKEGGKPLTIQVPVPLPDGWQMNQGVDFDDKVADKEERQMRPGFSPSGSAAGYGGGRATNATPMRRANKSPDPAIAQKSQSSRVAAPDSGVAGGVVSGVIGNSNQPASVAAPPAEYKPAPRPEADLSRDSKVANRAKGKDEAIAMYESEKLSKESAKAKKADANSLTDTKALDEIERYLGRSQAITGAWADADQNAVRTTAMATLAYVLNGNTARKGDYQPQLRRAIELINNSINANGELKDKGTVVDTQTLAITLWAMSEVVADSHNTSTTKTSEKLLSSLLKLRANSGLWLANIGGAESESSTAWALLALESAKTAGLTVDQTIIDSAKAALAKNGKDKFTLESLIKDLKLTHSEPIASAAARYLLLSKHN